ncbi:hypothetical protein NEDG_01701 [Nematocida displodere]|uniref:Uncharacterized protein n=1 Tax=Nematocida displodere TaxID=1805483 RepID=A0A177EE62_9MICR|nr:hypothetical protein NEDG_01701 [Nematocida displodere]
MSTQTSANTLLLLMKEMDNIAGNSKEAEEKIGEVKEAIEDAHAKLSLLKPLKHESLVHLSATAQSNLEQTKKLLAEIKVFDTTYTSLSAQIERSTKEVSTKSLLTLYKQIRRIESLEQTSPPITEKVVSLTKSFSILLFTLIDNIPDIIRTQSVVGFLKIAKVVEKQDLRVSSHRDKMFEVFLESIERKFREKLDDTPKSVLSPTTLDFIISDAKSIFLTEDTGLPPRYKIFSFAAIHYHRALYDYLDGHAESFDPNEALLILLWTKTYYKAMKALGKPKSTLGPVLFADKEPALISRYITAANEKLSTWIANLGKMESKRFKERKKAPDLDSSNKFISIGFMDLLHIIRQQLEPIYEHEEIFKQVSEHVKTYTENFKDTLVETINSELALVLKDKAKSGFEEYSIAIGNSGLKFMDCLQSLPFYAHSSIQAIGDVFYDCFLASNVALTKNILYVAHPALKHLFTSAWTSEPVSDTLIATLKDYLTDYKETMIDYAFTLFVSSLIIQVSTTYVDRLCKKHSVFRKEHLSLLAADKKKYQTFFSAYISKDTLRNNFSYFDFLIRLTTTDNLIITVSEVSAFYKAFPEEPSDRIKTILRKMPGGSKDFASEVLKRAEIPPSR